jgi:hypothetical protein
MYVNPSIVYKGKGAAESKSFEIILTDINDILTTPNRNDGKVLMVGNYQWKPGKYATIIQVTNSKTTLPLASEGEEDNASINSLPEFTMAGSPLEGEELMANWLNRGIIAFVKVGACGDPNPFWRVYGSKCAPLTLMPEGQNDNDGTNLMFKFIQHTKTDMMPGRYTGTITLATATVIAADAETVNVVNGDGEYQLTNNTDATIITDLINAVTGGTYTLLGSGGTNPATIEASNANFLLAGAVDWQGLAGAKLTVKAYDAGGGDHIFVEHSRS